MYGKSFWSIVTLVSMLVLQFSFSRGKCTYESLSNRHCWWQGTNSSENFYRNNGDQNFFPARHNLSLRISCLFSSESVCRIRGSLAAGLA